MNRLSTSNGRNLLIRMVSALVLAGICIPCMLFGGYSYFVLGLVIAFFGVYEFTACSSTNRYNFLIYLIIYAATFCMILWPFFFDDGMRFSFALRLPTLSASPLILLVYFFLLFGGALVSTRMTVHDATYLLVMGVYMAATIHSMYFLRFVPSTLDAELYKTIPSCLLVAYIVVGTVFNDIGAYLVGVAFGKHKMIPRISPHKTWEGFAGGVVISFLFSFFTAFIFEKCCSLPLLEGYLEFANGHFYRIVILSLVLPLTGDFGDLFFSCIKRNWGIKDFGKIIPGHGGVLDRVDSLSFNFIVSAVLVMIFLYGWRYVL